MKFFYSFVPFAAAVPTNDGLWLVFCVLEINWWDSVLVYTSVLQVSQQLAHIHANAGLTPDDAVGQAIEKWQVHESQLRLRDTSPDILNKFAAVGKELNLKGLIQRAM